MSPKWRAKRSISGFISTAVTLRLPAARATSTSAPPPGPMTSVSGSGGASLKGSARYQSFIAATLSSRPSQASTFVQASESM